jgi:hypothetical protein
VGTGTGSTNTWSKRDALDDITLGINMVDVNDDDDLSSDEGTDVPEDHGSSDGDEDNASKGM